MAKAGNSSSPALHTARLAFFQDVSYPSLPIVPSRMRAEKHTEVLFEYLTKHRSNSIFDVMCWCVCCRRFLLQCLLNLILFSHLCTPLMFYCVLQEV